VPPALWVALATAVLGTLGVVAAAKINGRSALTSSLDARAAKVLEDAMDYQGREIVSLRQRVDDLEAEVASCERGRAADRERWSHELDQLRAEVRRT
jgi:hypothetical protein